MGSHQSHHTQAMETFNMTHYMGTWYSVTGERLKICHHHAEGSKINIIIKRGTTKETEHGLPDDKRAGHFILDSNSNYYVHWTDYYNYSFVTLNRTLIVLCRRRHLEANEVQLVSLALKGCGLNGNLDFKVNDTESVDEVKMLSDDIFWSEIGKNTHNKTTYESKFSD